MIFVRIVVVSIRFRLLDQMLTSIVIIILMNYINLYRFSDEYSSPLYLSILSLKRPVNYTHGWTVERFQAYEKTIQEASMARQIATIRLLMQGYYAIQVAELLNLHRETVSEHVKKFNTSGMKGLLHREYAPGRRAYLLQEEEKEIRRILEFSTPVEEDTAMNRAGIPAF